MLKTFLAGATALAIVGGTFAFAQQQGPGEFQRVRHWSAEDISAFGDARIAALRAGLKLNAEQEKNWPAVESALRDLAKQRAERVAARANVDRPSDPIERLSRRADAMSQRAASLKKLADAAGPLYKSLDDGQKRRFAMLARFGARHTGWRAHRGFRDGWMHRGPRDMGGERERL